MFIWDGPIPVEYGASQYIAVAETVQEAREIVKNSQEYIMGALGSTSGSKPTGDGSGKLRTNLGQPSKVLDLPCGIIITYCE